MNGALRRVVFLCKPSALPDGLRSSHLNNRTGKETMVMNTSKLTTPASSTATATAAIPVAVQFRHMGESKRVTWLVNQMMEKFSKFPISGSTATVVVDETTTKKSGASFRSRSSYRSPASASMWLNRTNRPECMTAFIPLLLMCSTVLNAS